METILLEFIVKITFRQLSNVMQLNENADFLNEMFIQIHLKMVHNMLSSNTQHAD